MVSPTKFTDLKKGDRVELISTNDPFTSMDTGTRGIVLADYDPKIDQLQVRWDSGSWMSLIAAAHDTVRLVPDTDRFMECCPKHGKMGEPVDYTKHNSCGWWKCPDGDEYEARVMVTKTPALVPCLADPHHDPVGEEYATWQGAHVCNNDDCRAKFKIA